MSNTGKISVLLLEDEMQMRDMLTGWIATHPMLELRGVATNGVDGLKKMQQGGIELIFLDIDLPILSGLEMLEQLEEIPYLIFITVSEQHAIRAFELGAIDYLHKPFGKERFLQAVERACDFIRRGNEIEKPATTRGLIIAEGESHYLVSFQSIIYLTANDKNTIVHTEERDYETPKTLLTISGKLPGNQFLRIHKKYIINLSYLSHTKRLLGGRFQVFLSDADETSLTVGRKYASEFKKALAW